MDKPELQGGISWSWCNMSEEERRRSFAGKDRSLFCHDKGKEENRQRDRDEFGRGRESTKRSRRRLGLVILRFQRRRRYNPRRIKSCGLGCEMGLTGREGLGSSNLAKRLVQITA
ncbi:hypothetical protein F2Q69_00046146 [Brassica cretica]|uniref:Uncharacterized protein n=1 Tax=Brassica cretica TaxID=69181 RepID=A0A8S9PYL5_BRACR|nr:hypothetical protein F2Q69_00046146 [Brassica cretica]